MSYAPAPAFTFSWLPVLALALASCTQETQSPAQIGGQAQGGAAPAAAGASVGGGSSQSASGSAPVGGIGPGGGGSGASGAGVSGNTRGVGGGSGGSAGSAGAAGSSTAGTGTGSASMSGLPTPPGAANVPRPAGAVGGLKVLDWAGYKAAVSYTFDDSNSSQISRYAELAALGVRYTFYLQTGKSESQDPVWAQAAAAGHELGNHTKSHSSNATGEDIDAATKFIEEKFPVKVWTMAAPNGSDSYIPLAKTRFLINRGVNEALIGAGTNDNSDPFKLPCSIPATGASQSALDALVTSAQSAGKWRVILVHGFSGGTDGAYMPVAFDQLSKSISASKALGNVWIDSVVNVGAYWRAQKTLAQATPTTAGTAQTWSWTLPEHFPPGKYLRVSVTGGTPSQKDAPLTWDTHGYYEVSLDAGSLTLAP